jgi:hypothetical protein
LRHFLASRGLRFPVSARRYRLQVSFGAPVSGGKNPVPNSIWQISGEPEAQRLRTIVVIVCMRSFINIAVTKNLEAIAANPDQVNKKQYKLLRREMFGLQLAFNAAMLAYLASYFSPM